MCFSCPSNSWSFDARGSDEGAMVGFRNVWLTQANAEETQAKLFTVNAFEIPALLQMACPRV